MGGVIAGRRGWIVLAAAVVFLLHCTIFLRYTVDDSLISYRFARNWADGLGPVYNAGECVEGYTCFGWVALLALAHRLGLDIELASKALGLASGVVCILAAAAISRRLLDGRPTALIAPFVLAINPLFAAWACSGMETVLFSALIAGAAWALAGTETGHYAVPLSAVLLGLSALVRPEGVLFGAIGFAAMALGRDKRAGRYFLLRWGLTFAAIVTPYVIWRIAYYGSLVPNTFLAKTGRGPERLISGVWCCANFAEYQGLAFVALCIVGLWTAGPRSAAWRFARIALPAFAAYVVWAGGDILHIRFFVHVMGLLAVCAAVGFDRIARFDTMLSTCAVPSRRRPIAMYCAIAVAWVAISAVQDFRALHAGDQFGAAYVVNNARNVTLANIPLGKWLAAHAPAGSTAAVWDIGGVGYYSNLKIIDLYGLTDRTLARLIHSRASDAQKAAYVRSRRPDYIIAYASPGRADPQWLNSSPYFRRNYRFHSYWRGGRDGYGLAVMVRKANCHNASHFWVSRP